MKNLQKWQKELYSLQNDLETGKKLVIQKKEKEQLIKEELEKAKKQLKQDVHFRSPPF